MKVKFGKNRFTRRFDFGFIEFYYWRYPPDRSVLLSKAIFYKLTKLPSEKREKEHLATKTLKKWNRFH